MKMNEGDKWKIVGLKLCSPGPKKIANFLRSIKRYHCYILAWSFFLWYFIPVQIHWQDFCEFFLWSYGQKQHLPEFLPYIQKYFSNSKNLFPWTDIVPINIPWKIGVTSTKFAEDMNRRILKKHVLRKLLLS